MHVHFLDPYRPGRSLIHQADPRVKFVLALGLILTVALAPVGAWPVYFVLFSLVLAIVILSELGVIFVFKRAMLALPFVLAALPVIFTLDGPVLFSFPVGPWVLSATTTGMERFFSVALKSWLSVQVAIVLAASTRFPELLQAMRSVGVPRLLVAIFSLMWRYLFVLADEALRLMRARAARSGAVEMERRAGGSLAWRARVTGGMAGSLFLRAIERSDRIYMAMVARGYDGEVRALPLPELRRAQWLTVFIGLGSLALFLLVAFLIWG